MARWFGEGVSPADVPRGIVIVVVGMALSSPVTTVLYTRLLATAGAVFGSQASAS